jgi:hypothetical protein
MNGCGDIGEMGRYTYTDIHGVGRQTDVSDRDASYTLLEILDRLGRQYGQQIDILTDRQVDR